MKKLLGTGAMLLLIIYLLPVCCRIYTGSALGDKAKDMLAVYADNGGTGGNAGPQAAAMRRTDRLPPEKAAACLIRAAARSGAPGIQRQAARMLCRRQRGQVVRWGWKTVK